MLKIFTVVKDTLDGQDTIRVEGEDQTGPPGQPILVKNFPNDQWTAWYQGDQADQSILIRLGVTIS